MNESIKNQPTQITVMTIGHSTRSLEEFIDLLHSYMVEKVVDIRTIPRSRHNPQFNKENLQKNLKGIEYLHMPGLGGLRHTKADSPNKGWKNDSFRGFADYMLTEEFEENLEKLIELAGRHQIVIMCAEVLPWRCHRSLVADALMIRGIEVKHIYSTTSIKSHKITQFAKVEGKKISYPAAQ